MTVPIVSTTFLTHGNFSFCGGDRLRATVGRRPEVTAPKFGRWLELQRAGRSLEQIAIQVRPLVQQTGMKVSRSLILKLEQGRVPNWPMLGALCRVYGADIHEAVLQLVQTITFPGSADLLCPADGVQHAFTPLPGAIPEEVGANNVSASLTTAPVPPVSPTESALLHDVDLAARLLETADRLRAYANEITRRQIAVVSDLSADGHARPRKAHRRAAR